jgi:hypothetical protein
MKQKLRTREKGTDSLGRAARAPAIEYMEDAGEARLHAEQAEQALRKAYDEVRMIELKRQVNELCGRLSQPPCYPPDFEKEQP